MALDVNILLAAIVSIFTFLSGLQNKWLKSSKREKVDLALKLANNRDLMNTVRGTVIAIKGAVKDKKMVKSELEEIASKVVDLSNELERIDWEQM